MLLRSIKGGSRDAVIGPFWGPRRTPFIIAPVRAADLRFDGKAANASGASVDAKVEVELVENGSWSFGTSKASFGDGAGVRIGGVEVALLSQRPRHSGSVSAARSQPLGGN